jgi:hypothetical protein
MIIKGRVYGSGINSGFISRLSFVNVYRIGGFLREFDFDAIIHKLRSPRADRFPFSIPPHNDYFILWHYKPNISCMNADFKSELALVRRAVKCRNDDKCRRQHLNIVIRITGKKISGVSFLKHSVFPVEKKLLFIASPDRKMSGSSCLLNEVSFFKNSSFLRAETSSDVPFFMTTYPPLPSYFFYRDGSCVNDGCEKNPEISTAFIFLQ